METMQWAPNSTGPSNVPSATGRVGRRDLGRRLRRRMAIVPLLALGTGIPVLGAMGSFGGTTDEIGSAAVTFAMVLVVLVDVVALRLLASVLDDADVLHDRRRGRRVLLIGVVVALTVLVVESTVAGLSLVVVTVLVLPGMLVVAMDGSDARQAVGAILLGAIATAPAFVVGLAGGYVGLLVGEVVDSTLVPGAPDIVLQAVVWTCGVTAAHLVTSRAVLTQARCTRRSQMTCTQ